MDRIQETKGKKRAFNKGRAQNVNVYLAMTVEGPGREENTRQLYNRFRNLVGKYCKPERPVNNEGDKTITRNRWVEHFIKLLNGKTAKTLHILFREILEEG